jgi:hypothetical protein
MTFRRNETQSRVPMPATFGDEMTGDAEVEHGEWRHGVQRTGETLVVRDRWQGLFGPNGWLTMPLFAVGAVGAWGSITRLVCDPSDRQLLDFGDLQVGDSQISVPTCDSKVTRFRGVDELDMTSVWITVACALALAFVALRFYPIVSFGPQILRWRNWFRWKETSTDRIAGLDLLNYNSRAWVPAVAVVMKGRIWRSQAHDSSQRSGIASSLRRRSPRRSIPGPTSAESRQPSDRRRWCGG